MRFYFLFTAGILLHFFCHATHNMAGEITYRYLSGYTYEITIKTYTKTSGTSLLADRPQLDSVNFGDGTNATFIRQSTNDVLDVNNDFNIRINTYVHTHTYPAAGIYTISFADPNRNAGVINMIQSVNQAFSIQTIIAVFDPSTNCINNSSVPTPRPIMHSVTGKNFVHNVAAFDPDKDSLSFEIVPCNYYQNTVAIGYYIPAGISVNPVSGEITWNFNDTVGSYNVAVRIWEWRNHIRMAYVTRDFEITNYLSPDTSFNFGNTSAIPTDANGNYSMTLQPGDSANLSFYFEDLHSSHVRMNALMENFNSNSPAVTIDTTTSLHQANVSFFWKPDSTQARNHPYIFVFRGSADSANQRVEKDLTLLVYVNGIQHDSCPAFADYFISVNDLPIENDIMVFPNPIHEKINVHVDAGILTNNKLNFEIFDLLGKKLMQMNVIESDFQLKIGNLATGIYLYEFSNNDGEIFKCGKLIIH
jgi:hypothetical protein